MSREIAGRFVLLDQIGSGGMGSVWRAWDRRIERTVAAKLLDARDPRGQGDHLLRFVREQSMRVRHRHVVAPTGWAADDEAVVLAMDLVRGGSVAELLGEHRMLPLGYVAVLLDQLLQALTAAHDATIVHRDLKPANLLLEPTGTGIPHLRLADFGVAAHAQQAASHAVAFPGVVGTDGYMPAEQAAGAPAHPVQDVYGAGRVAIELLTGHRPHRQDGAPAGPLHDLLTAMVEPDPARRIGSARLARERLADLGIRFRDGGPGQPLVPDRLGDADVPGAPPAEGVVPARRRRPPWWLRS